MTATSSPTTVLQGDGLGGTLSVSASDPNGATLSASKKRKKRKKKAGTVIALNEEDDPLLREAEAKIFGDDEEAWRNRARVRLDRLRAVARDVDDLRRELSEAANRFADAERAEQLVNSGLRSAHTLLAEREKSLATATSEGATLTAEVASLTG